VGDARAVNTAVGVLGRPRLVAALPFLQTGVLTRTTRQLAGDRRREVSHLLERLRKTGAEVAGVEPPELTQLRRLNLTSLAMAIGALVATAVLLDEVGDPGQVWTTVQGADWQRPLAQNMDKQKTTPNRLRFIEHLGGKEKQAGDYIVAGSWLPA
jgi:hypothetical protein